MPFHFSRTKIPEVVLIEPRLFPDARGFFAEIYKASDFRAHGIAMSVAQVNHSRSEKDVLRGLHYQLNPKAQDKIVMAVKGEIFDVAVDIRQGSPTFGRWVGERLSEANKRMLYLPAGFAHGFCALSDEVEIVYFCSEEYDASCERTICWNDPAINIVWPIQSPILSSKDSGGKLLAQAENNFVFKAS